MGSVGGSGGSGGGGSGGGGKEEAKKGDGKKRGMGLVWGAGVIVALTDA